MRGGWDPMNWLRLKVSEWWRETCFWSFSTFTTCRETGFRGKGGYEVIFIGEAPEAKEVKGLK